MVDSSQPIEESAVAVEKDETPEENANSEESAGGPAEESADDSSGASEGDPKVSIVSEAESAPSNRKVLAKIYGDDRRGDERRWAVGGFTATL